MASLQYTFIFLLMVTEVVIFGLLLIPLPVTWRKNMFNVLSKSVMVKKALFYVKIMYSFVFFMFVDAVLKLYKIHQREDTDTILDERMIAQLRMSKFYAQRNFYLTGFTLLLGL
ncbi:Endoplasmic reticulum transmembrane protein 3, partial [Spiromyces aspiralis]